MNLDKITLIINENSGKQDSSNRTRDIVSCFETHGVDAEVIRIGKDCNLPAAVKAALQTESQTIVVAGGDGTICGVAAELVNSDRHMGIIASGTFNYFARSLKLPEDIAEAVAVIVRGRTIDLDVATINGQVFLNNTSLGAYAAILQTREGIYKRWGRSRVAAYWSVIKALATLRAPLHLTIELDGKTQKYRTPLVFVINNAFQLQQMGLGGEDCIEKGEMVLLVAPDTSRWGLIKHAAALAFGVAKHRTDYEMHCGKKIEIVTKVKRRKVAKDGELERMSAPFKLEKLVRALHVHVPDNFQDTTR